MLSPQLLTVNAQDLYDAPINHPYVQKALAFAVEQYNLDNEESANYFKVLRLLKTQWKHLAAVAVPTKDTSAISDGFSSLELGHS
ncbi:hypothetical protein L345_15265, partial [Ophiophagus hannah]